MKLHRISVKYYLQDPGALELTKIGPVFHRWIREQSVEGMLIDVADYQHVHHGPGMMLLGHEGDYSLNLEDGRAGFLYCSKRHRGELPDRLRDTFRNVLKGCQVLEKESSLSGRLRFRTDEAQIEFLDRLGAPNNPEVFQRLEGHLEALAERLYPGSNPGVSRCDRDDRACLAVRVSASGAPALPELLSRLE